MTYKKLPLVFLLLITSFFGFGQSDIIISQYIETNSGTTPKGIEIFNVSGADITFTPTNNLQIYQGTNGGTCNAIVSTNITTGTLAADEVWVIGTSDLTFFAITNGTNLSGTNDYSFTFNGDDALQLYLGGILQDQFGICGSDPGSSWSGSGVSTANNNLEIQNGLCDGDTDGWTDPSIRFNQIANGSTMTGFGNAPTSCSSCTDTLSWYNLESPANASITIGENLNVFAQAWEPGITDSSGQGSNIEVWIGYSITDTDPSTWAESSWISANYDSDNGNNDLYILDLGSEISSTGTYYYASRFSYNGCDYTYGGYNGGTWDGSTNVSGVLIINPDQVDFCNVEFPKTGSTTIGINHQPWVDGGFRLDMGSSNLLSRCRSK